MPAIVWPAYGLVGAVTIGLLVDQPAHAQGAGTDPGGAAG